MGDNPPSVHSEAFHVAGFFAPEAVIRREGSMGIGVHIAVAAGAINEYHHAAQAT
ncbi:hypothetical protein ABT120_50215 [Nonomuraea angiospora]|uniref:hypothetical protein n=1 Tax=Nonomuraea angiospora TaxID=46172 RepID=UPI003333B80B